MECAEPGPQSHLFAVGSAGVFLAGFVVLPGYPGGAGRKPRWGSPVLGHAAVRMEKTAGREILICGGIHQSPAFYRGCGAAREGGILAGALFAGVAVDASAAADFSCGARGGGQRGYVNGGASAAVRSRADTLLDRRRSNCSRQFRTRGCRRGAVSRWRWIYLS